jgi:hypothetical protein
MLSCEEEGKEIQVVHRGGVKGGMEEQIINGIMDNKKNVNHTSFPVQLCSCQCLCFWSSVPWLQQPHDQCLA